MLWLVDEHLRADGLRQDTADCGQDKRDLRDIIHQKNEVIADDNKRLALRDTVGKAWEAKYNNEFDAHKKTTKRLGNNKVVVKVLIGLCLLLAAFGLSR